MAKLKVGIVVFLVPMFLLSAIAGGTKLASAAEDGGRQTVLIAPYTEYEWWLIRWSDNEILCTLFIDHEGLPTASEVYNGCSAEAYQEWLATPPCKQIVNGSSVTTGCSGLYFHLVSSQPKERQVVIDLPEPTVWVSLEDCLPVPPDNFCSNLPTLVLTGEEPLPNESITAIQGTYSDIMFYCAGDRCALPMQTTPMEGVLVEFWAESSFGDTSEKFTAQVRVIDSGVSTAPGGGGYFVDVISTQWRGKQLASCAKSWEAFPPAGGTPGWLSTPEQTTLLNSDKAYYYLAGRLIAQGVVDASSCVTGGMLANGYADACGLELARPAVQEWQNQFDARILEVSQQTSVPAQLLKNLFAQESQFWPGVFRVPLEFGLGQITDKGADAILLWDEEFYNEFCPLVLAEESCSAGYLKLKPDDQAILRGALAIEAKADCPECPAGIDLSNANTSVALFAQSLQANCDQVGQIIATATEQTPGSISDYEDLWRFTIANYHAGPGCLSYAIHMAWQSSPGRLDWENVAEYFTDACKGVIPYVEKISQ